MCKIRKSILFLLCFLVVVTGSIQCYAKTSSSKKEITSSWKIIKNSSVSQSVDYMGFQNRSYGITVGSTGFVHYTNDGGKTWTAGKINSQSRYGLDIINEKIAWNCGDASQVRKTADGGKTWQAVSDFSIETQQNFLMSFIDEKTGWIISNLGEGEYGITMDGGKNWIKEKLPEGIGTVAAVSLSTANDCYLLNSTGFLYFTNDGGKTWKNKDLGLNKFKFDDGKIINDSSPHAVIRFTDSKNGIVSFNGISQYIPVTYVMETADGGNTWSKQKLQISSNELASGALFLSHDGKYLTSSNSSGNYIVFEKNSKMVGIK